jgi:hypothetical protein
MRDENQLHAAVVELVALDGATIKYSTVQNWYPGDKDGKGGIYNFVTKRGKVRGVSLEDLMDPGRNRVGDHLEVSGMHSQGDESVGEFYSVALTNNRQQADTGTKMIHIGKNTKSTIVSKGISAGHGQNTYRGAVKILKGADGARNYSQCDSMLLGDLCGAHTFPYIDVANPTATVEHEASTSKIGEDQIFYFQQRGISKEDAVNMIVNGFCKEVFREPPDGVRGGGPEAARHQSRRERRLIMLKIDNLHASVGGTPILKGIDLDVKAGEVHAIMGPNGSGKSTLAQVLAGREAYEITQGSITLEGKDLLELQPEDRARDGLFLAFQYRSRFPGSATSTS